MEEQDIIVDDFEGVFIPDQSESLVESSSQALSVMGNSDNIQKVQTGIDSNETQGLTMKHRKRYIFVKPDPDQIAAEARAKEKNKDA